MLSSHRPEMIGNNLCYLLMQRENNFRYQKIPSRFTANLYREHYRIAKNLYKTDFVGHYGCVNAVEFSSGGQYLASGGDDKRVLVWDIEKSLAGFGKARVLDFEHSSNIFCLAFDSQNRKLISGGNDDLVVSHDFKTGQLDTVFKQENPVYGVSIDPQNDSNFATASENGKIYIFDQRANPCYPLLIAEQRSAFHAVEFHPTYDYLLVTANSKQGAALYDSRQPNQPVVQYGHERDNPTCMSVRFNRTGNMVLALRRRLPPILYHTQYPEPICTFYHKNYYNSCTMKSCTFAGEDDELVISGSDDFNLYVWRISDIDTDARAQWIENTQMVLYGHRSIVNQVRYNRQKCLLASSGVEKIVKIWSPFAQRDWSGSLLEAATSSENPREMFSSFFVNVMTVSSLSHDYSTQNTNEDPRMLAFFDSLIRQEIDGLETNSSSESPIESEHSNISIFTWNSQFSSGSDTSSSSDIVTTDVSNHSFMRRNSNSSSHSSNTALNTDNNYNDDDDDDDDSNNNNGGGRSIVSEDNNISKNDYENNEQNRHSINNSIKTLFKRKLSQHQTMRHKNRTRHFMPISRIPGIRHNQRNQTNSYLLNSKRRILRLLALKSGKTIKSSNLLKFINSRLPLHLNTPTLRVSSVNRHNTNMITSTRFHNQASCKTTLNNPINNSTDTDKPSTSSAAAAAARKKKNTMQSKRKKYTMSSSSLANNSPLNNSAVMLPSTSTGITTSLRGDILRLRRQQQMIFDSGEDDDDDDDNAFEDLAPASTNDTFLDRLCFRRKKINGLQRNAGNTCRNRRSCNNRNHDRNNLNINNPTNSYNSKTITVSNCSSRTLRGPKHTAALSIDTAEGRTSVPLTTTINDNRAMNTNSITTPATTATSILPQSLQTANLNNIYDNSHRSIENIHNENVSNELAMNGNDSNNIVDEEDNNGQKTNNPQKPQKELNIIPNNFNNDTVSTASESLEDSIILSKLSEKETALNSRHNNTGGKKRRQDMSPHSLRSKANYKTFDLRNINNDYHQLKNHNSHNHIEFIDIPQCSSDSLIKQENQNQEQKQMEKNQKKKEMFSNTSSSDDSYLETNDSGTSPKRVKLTLENFDYKPKNTDIYSCDNSNDGDGPKFEEIENKGLNNNNIFTQEPNVHFNRTPPGIITEGDQLAHNRATNLFMYTPDSGISMNSNHTPTISNISSASNNNNYYTNFRSSTTCTDRQYSYQMSSTSTSSRQTKNRTFSHLIPCLDTINSDDDDHENYYNYNHKCDREHDDDDAVIDKRSSSSHAIINMNKTSGMKKFQQKMARVRRNYRKHFVTDDSDSD